MNYSLPVIQAVRSPFINNPFFWMFLAGLSCGSALGFFLLRYKEKNKGRSFPIVMASVSLSASFVFITAGFFLCEINLVNSVLIWLLWLAAAATAFAVIRWFFKAGIAVIAVFFIVFVLCNNAVLNWTSADLNPVLIINSQLQSGLRSVEYEWQGESGSISLENEAVYPVFFRIEFHPVYLFFPHDSYVFFYGLYDDVSSLVPDLNSAARLAEILPGCTLTVLDDYKIRTIAQRESVLTLLEDGEFYYDTLPVK